ncbi:MAG: hypothetical protein JWP03_135 [Phycisphaerales bacterium]|nr:hypothetical protein [Phycisphaerales bacterium]
MTNRGTTVEFHSSLSDLESSDEAVEQVIDDARDAIDGADVVFAFFTPHHRDQAAFIVEQLWLELDPQCAVGCVGEGVIGGDREIERQPGLAILVGKMPGARLHPFHIAGKSHWHDLIEDADALRDRIGIGEETRAVIGMGDPFSTPLDAFLPALDAAAPGIPLIGGMASGGRAPGVNVLARNDEIFDEGFVGISLSGPLEVETIVSQGSRPIGRPLVITRSHDNVIEQLGGRPAVEVLREIVTSLSESDQHLLQHGLLVGRAISEYRETFGRGDFLVRNIIGMDEQTGAIAMADYVRTGQTIQFHARDAATASEELAAMLEPQSKSRPPAGALLFSCNGRGTRLFDAPCHDITAARRAMPNTPVAGFFAAGEFGPVGGKNFIHGHTASFALLRGH